MTIILIKSAVLELTPDEIQEDFHFFQLVSVFVGAIRCGVLEVEHAKEPLAHYGRFGPTYDAIVKKLIDVLRDEGIYNKEADTVQHVAGSALQQSFNIFLDSEEDEPIAPLALARVIATAFVIHGSQFAVLRQLHPSDVCDFHLEALDFVSRKLSTTVKQEGNARNKEQKSRLTKKKWAVLTFFKMLIPLLGPVTGKDALKIKAHLEDVIDSSGVQLTTNKGWDGYRAYEKRLIGIASKDPNVKMASKKVVEREGTEQGDEEDVEEVDDEEAEREKTPTAQTRPKPKGRRRSNTITHPSPSAVSTESSLTPAPSSSPAHKGLLSPSQQAGPQGQKHAREDSLDLQLTPPPADNEAGDLQLDLDLDLDGIGPSQRVEEVAVEPEQPSLKRRKTRRG